MDSRLADLILKGILAHRSQVIHHVNLKKSQGGACFMIWWSPEKRKEFW